MTRARICLICGTEFRYGIGKGNDRKHCSPECRVKHQMKLRAERFEKLPICKGPDCTNKATRISYGLCEQCYYRLRRNGNTDRRKIKGRYIVGSGYIKILMPNHSLAEKGGHIYEHRMVLYDKYGSDIQECFWCGKSLIWKNIKCDHLDENKQNNKPENLAISCNECNRARGAMLPFIKRMKDERIDILFDGIKKYRFRM